MGEASQTILAIDPGPERSAWVLLKGGELLDGNILVNEYLFDNALHQAMPDVMVCEWIESYGMAVGADIFETCYQIGVFARTCEDFNIDAHRLTRREVKLHLCNSSRAKDKNVRQALIDRFPATGGGKVPQIGVKAKPGPLFGMRSHLWSALAVGITYRELNNGDQR